MISDTSGRERSIHELLLMCSTPITIHSNAMYTSIQYQDTHTIFVFFFTYLYYLFCPIHCPYKNMDMIDDKNDFMASQNTLATPFSFKKFSCKKCKVLKAQLGCLSQVVFV